MTTIRHCRVCNKEIKEKIATMRTLCRECYKERSIIQHRTCSKVGWAKISGKLPRLDGTIKCMDCGEPAMVYEHRDYFKPLDVDPVCKKCNRLRGEGKWKR